MGSVDYDHELNNGWGKFPTLLLTALRDITEEQRRLRDNLTEIKTEDLAELKTDMTVVKMTTGRLDAIVTAQGLDISGLKGDRQFFKGSWKTIGVVAGVLAGLATLGVAIASLFVG